MKKIKIREGQGKVKIDFATFKKRYEEFFAMAYEDLAEEKDLLIQRAWEVYQGDLDSDTKVKAGSGFQKKNFEVPQAWLETSQHLKALEKERKHAKKSRVLLINGSPRSDNTCPSEMSKTHRLCLEAHRTFQSKGVEVEYLDLSRLTSEYGKKIYPCKACVSTAMPLCHWPCSCYPNHKLGQVQDWMSEIYGMWVKAHGIMIITPTHWYSPPSVLKLMMDRLVCADGGNPDPTTTEWKTPELAKKIEMKGWDFPKHLAGRVFSVIAHGDSEGVGKVKQTIVDWLQDMDLKSADYLAELDRYIGYYGTYAESHEDLDKDKLIQKEVKHAAELLVKAISKERKEKDVSHKRCDEIRPK